MQFKMLDGETYNISLKNFGEDRECRSQYHIEVKELIRKLYANLTILEEVPIKIDKKKTLYFDFFILEKMLAIDVNGIQHYEYTPHFHKTKIEFFQQKKNDREKREWVEINGLDFASLRWDEPREIWEYRIKKPISLSKIKVFAGDVNKNKTCVAISDGFYKGKSKIAQHTLYRCLSCGNRNITESVKFLQNKIGCKKCATKITCTNNRKGTIARNGRKICSSCQIEKSTDEFCKNDSRIRGYIESKDGYTCWCKFCIRGKQLRKYGYNKNPILALQEYEEELTLQNYLCIFCNEHMDENDRHIHHCHETNIRHGISHSQCNLEEGVFKKGIISKKYIHHYCKHNPELIEEIENQINGHKSSYKHIRIRTKPARSARG